MHLVLFGANWYFLIPKSSFGGVISVIIFSFNNLFFVPSVPFWMGSQSKDCSRMVIFWMVVYCWWSYRWVSTPSGCTYISNMLCFCMLSLNCLYVVTPSLSGLGNAPIHLETKWATHGGWIKLLTNMRLSSLCTGMHSLVHHWRCYHVSFWWMFHILWDHRQDDAVPLNL